MKVHRVGSSYRRSFQGGPRHVLLGLVPGALDPAETPVVALPVRGTCDHGPLDPARIRAAVGQALTDVEAQTGHRVRLASIEYVPNDSPYYEMHYGHAVAIAQAIAADASRSHIPPGERKAFASPLAESEAAFVTVPTRRGARGTGPDLPDGTGFLLLASPSVGSAFALYEISSADLGRCQEAVPVPGSLSDLLRRAEGHPPAMALMRDAVIHRVLDAPSRDLFLWRVGRLLERYLQPEELARHVSARSIVDEPGYRTAGQDYWLVAYSPQEECVSWVSADFFVYNDPVKGFEVSADALARLPGAPRLFWPDDSDGAGRPAE